MDPKEDAAFAAPPDGVEVWTACLAGQQSYELDDAAEGRLHRPALRRPGARPGREGPRRRHPDTGEDDAREAAGRRGQRLLEGGIKSVQAGAAVAAGRFGAEGRRDLRPGGGRGPRRGQEPGGRAGRRRHEGDPERAGRDRHAARQGVERGQWHPRRGAAAVPGGQDGRLRARRRHDRPAQGRPQRPRGHLGAEHGLPAGRPQGRRRQDPQGSDGEPGDPQGRLPEAGRRKQVQGHGCSRTSARSPT